MKNYLTIIEHLKRNGANTVPMSVYKVARLKTKWRSIYSAGLKKKFGVSRKNGFDWHAFTWGEINHLNRSKAILAGIKLKDEQWYLWGDFSSKWGYEISGHTPINITGACEDFILSGLSLNWTLVFTHESTCGPYYCDSSLLCDT